MNLTALTSSFSLYYLAIFLPAVLIIYSIMPQKIKKYVLLAASIFFAWLISGELVLYLLFSILLIHYFGMWMELVQKERDEKAKAAPREERKPIRKAYEKKLNWILLFGIALNLGILLGFKYTAFVKTNVNELFTLLHISKQFKVAKFVMPIGISFYTMQALSYLVDVKRGVIKADRNIFRLGLFLSFFPELVEGPICRYGQTAEKLWNVGPIKYENFTLGVQRILYGAMKKIVVADRLNSIVEAIFAGGATLDGGTIFLGAVLYTVQLYCDFSGAMDAVMGTAQIFGMEFPENFRHPFFSKTISEFWQRWHITLGTWFKDYIFYPVTMSGPAKKITLKARKKLGNHYGPLVAGSVALFCVWSCNGLWHGAAWHYLFFGMYHFFFILLGNVTEPIRQKACEVLHIAKGRVWTFLVTCRTVFLVIIGEMFFEASSVKDGIGMFQKIFTDFRPDIIKNILCGSMAMDKKDFLIVFVTMCIVLIISLLTEKGIDVRAKIASKPVVFRYAFWLAAVMFIVVFGAYGHGYVPVDPMYANF